MGINHYLFGTLAYLAPENQPLQTQSKRSFIIKVITHTLLMGIILEEVLIMNLGFNQNDRLENIRRVAEISKLIMDAGIIVNAAFISPLISDRKIIKDIVGVKNLFEIYVSTSLEECEKRDVKGLYEKARKGLIKDFTGITSKYEPPKNPDVVIDTQDKDISVCVNEILPKIISKIKLDA